MVYTLEYIFHLFPLYNLPSSKELQMHLQSSKRLLFLFITLLRRRAQHAGAVVAYHKAEDQFTYTYIKQIILPVALTGSDGSNWCKVDLGELYGHVVAVDVLETGYECLA